MPFQLIRNDITRMEVDAIVNAANKSLRGGGGVDGAIHAAAGPELLRECSRLGGCEVGQAKITKGYRLPAKYVIHTVGPVWAGGKNGEKELLRNCYINSLKLAKEHGLTSVAFPLISSGIYAMPRDIALKVATDSIREFLDRNDDDMEVFLVIYDKTSLAISEEMYGDIRQYIDSNCIGRAHEQGRQLYRDRYGEEENRKLFESLKDSLKMESEDYVDVSDYLGTLKDINDAALEAEDPDEIPAYRGLLKFKADLEWLQEERKKLNDSIDAIDGMLNYDIDGELLAGSVAANEEDVINVPEDDFASNYLNSLNTVKLYEAPDLSQQLSKERLFKETGTQKPPAKSKDLKGIIGEERDESFQQMLFRKIDEKGMKDSECYKKANIDRKLFSKIRSDAYYHPKKNTVAAFAVALELSLEETEELMKKAGYALYDGFKFDLILKYFIQRGIYDIYTINDALFSFDQPLLGSL